MKKYDPKFEILTTDSLADDGSWEWDVQTNQVRATPSALRVFGLDFNSDGYSMYDLLNSIHPDDRSTVDKHIRSLTTGKKQETTIEYRVCHNELFNVYARTYGKALYNEEGVLTHLVGITNFIEP